MPTARKRLLQAIEKALGKRKLYWSGTRGDDALSLSDIKNFSGSLTYINRFAAYELDVAVSYEDITGRRVDLDEWDIDDHLREPDVLSYRKAHLLAMSSDNAVVPYRSTSFLSAMLLARSDRSLDLSMPAAHQKLFEYKPFVEMHLEKLGIPSLNQQYIADEDQRDALPILKDGPVVLRPSKGSGGLGIEKAASREDLIRAWPKNEELFATISKYLEGCPSINVGAVVFDNREVVLHLPSIQVVGVPYLVDRMFGYCGNDFSAIKRMDPLIVEQIEKTTVSIGQWMHSVGYRGAFGVDYLLDGGTLRFTEINPRFQGSTRVSAYLSLQRDEPCILIDHIAAMLHFEPISRAPLADAIQNTPDTAHIVLHDSQKLDNRGRLPSIVEGVQKIGGRADVIIGQEMPADNGCVLASFTLPTHVTNDGFHLFEAVEGIFDVREKG